MATNIIFKNEPKLSEHEEDAHFNERRLALAGQLESFITSHNRFQNKEVSITFAHTGISSLISIIEMPDEKLVLKIPLSPTLGQGEAQFLKVWEQAGVKVPHVFEDGMLGEHPFILMEYLDAPILSKAYSPEELTEKGIHQEMGRILRRMHTPEATGYGPVINGKVEFPTLNDWLLGADMQKRITYIQEHHLLGEEHGSIEQAFRTLRDYIDPQPYSSYCHGDFGAANIFATTPLTVFDPNPKFNNGYIDVALSMVNSLASGMSPAQLLEGYFNGEAYDKEALRAAVLLNTHIKFPYWHKVKKVEQIQRMQEYLSRPAPNTKF